MKKVNDQNFINFVGRLRQRVKRYITHSFDKFALIIQ